MNLNILESLVLGVISGLAEMLPISAEAHRTLFRFFFGVESEPALWRLLIHLGTLIGLCTAYSHQIRNLRLAGSLMKIPPKRRRNRLDHSDANTLRLLRTAAITMTLCRLSTTYVTFLGEKLNLLVFGLSINGFLLLVPSLVRSGNMNSRNMPRILGLLMGIGSGAGVIPGISPITGAMTLGQWQGVDKSFALMFAHLLLIPSLLVSMFFDAIALLGGGLAGLSFSAVLVCLAGAAAAAVAARWGVLLSQAIVSRASFSGLAYYSWGMALLCLVLFLMI